MLNLKLESCYLKSELEKYLIQSENNEILRKVQFGEDTYRDNLGWHEVERWAGEDSLIRLEELAANIRKNADVFVLIGVGGSNNAARSVIKALQGNDGPEIIYGGNTLSPIEINRILKKVEGKSFYINCIAKNFETLEPGSSFRVLRCLLAEKYGSEAKKRIIATGTVGSKFEKLCAKEGYTFLEFPVDIGGRYSAMTNVGLLPMAVAGIDIRALVGGAREMEFKLKKTGPLENPAYKYSCLRKLCWDKGYRIELLSSFDTRLRWFYKWWIQLFAESEGKDGKGIFPTAAEYSEELHSMGQYVQEGTPFLFESFINILDMEDTKPIATDGIQDGFDYLNRKSFLEINKSAYEATRKAHSERVPCLEIQLDRLDAKCFGEMFYFFQFACYISCRLQGVNPFNQPGVEAYKKEMFQILKR